jgi:glutamate dehydrogenase/leucine dehydrogenase
MPMVQNIQGFIWDEEKVNKELQKYVICVFFGTSRPHANINTATLG